MKAQETTSNKKNYNFTSIRVKDGTKEAVNKFLAKINKTEDCGKVTSDLLINFFLEKVTKEDVDMLPLRVPITAGSPHTCSVARVELLSPMDSNRRTPEIFTIS